MNLIDDIVEITGYLQEHMTDEMYDEVHAKISTDGLELAKGIEWDRVGFLLTDDASISRDTEPPKNFLFFCFIEKDDEGKGIRGHKSIIFKTDDKGWILSYGPGGIINLS